jgi:hypothetical protein
MAHVQTPKAIPGKEIIGFSDTYGVFNPDICLLLFPIFAHLSAETANNTNINKFF